MNELYEIAAEFDRLFPDLVDAESGHIAHPRDEVSIVGWYGACGTGNPVVSVPNGEIAVALAVLRGLRDVSGIRDVLAAVPAFRPLY